MKDRKEYLRNYRKQNKERLAAAERAYRLNRPWILYRNWAKNRCNNPNHKEYAKYGGRGIRVTLTVHETKIIWFRDKAYAMERPSLDRIESDKNYSFGNCRFMELKENVARAHRKQPAAAAA
jgi:hypothetical protein